MPANTYVKRPVTIQAIQYTGNNGEEIAEFAGLKEFEDYQGACIRIKTLEGTMVAQKNDWIIRGVKGEFYPCKPDIFEETYTLVEG